MAESAANTYATTSSNIPATTPNAVAVVQDAAGNIRQLMISSMDDNGNAVGPTNYFNNALSTTVQTVKGTSGYIAHVHFVNTNTADAYIQVFDAATATTVTLGTTTPTKSFIVPAGASSTQAGAFAAEWDIPLTFANGIKIAATTTSNGSTAPTTGIVVNIGWK